MMDRITIEPYLFGRHGPPTYVLYQVFVDDKFVGYKYTEDDAYELGKIYL